MEFDPSKESPAAFYQHLIRVISPRPIAWVSTISLSGIANLAPFSFFTGAGSRPPSVIICPSNRRDGAPKDTLRNILETGEFVINAVSFSLVEAMSLSSAELPPEESEFEFASVLQGKSVSVKPPRVAGSSVAIECRLMHHIALSEGPGAANIIVGHVQHLHVEDAVMDASGMVDMERLDLVGRLGGASYCRTTDQFKLARPGL